MPVPSGPLWPCQDAAATLYEPPSLPLGPASPSALGHKGVLLWGDGGQPGGMVLDMQTPAVRPGPGRLSDRWPLPLLGVQTEQHRQRGLCLA